MDFSSPAAYVVGISWLISVGLAYKLWRGPNVVTLKIGFTLVLFIPLVGPFMYLWIHGAPSPQPEHLQNRKRFRRDLLDRWSENQEQPQRDSRSRRHANRKSRWRQ